MREYCEGREYYIYCGTVDAQVNNALRRLGVNSAHVDTKSFLMAYRGEL